MQRAKARSPGRCRGSKADDCCSLLLLLGRFSGLRRRIHRRLVGADILEQHRAIRQVSLAQAGARRCDRTSNRVRGANVVGPYPVAAPVPVHVVPVAVAPVEVVSMPPETGMTMPVAVPAPVQMHMPAQMDVPAQMDMRAQMDMPAKMQVPTMAVDMTDHARVPDQTGPAHTVAAMTDDTVVTTTATAAVRRRIGTSGDKRRHTNDGGGDQSEECRTFEHARRPLGSMWAIRAIGRKRRAPGSSG
jgi:hypothetical protein